MRMTVIYQSTCKRMTVYSHLFDGRQSDAAEEAREGLRCREGKRIACRYFYDSNGSTLFDRITRLPEYYQTRTEVKLLRRHAADLVANFTRGDLVEIGSGSSRKISILLSAAERMSEHAPSIRYVPLDVSHEAMVEAGREVIEAYPWVDVVGRVTDFNRSLTPVTDERPMLVLFLGSTVGNLDDREIRSLFGSVANLMGKRDRFLVGFDMVKAVETIQAAYNDSQGVTAQFNRNALTVFNDVWKADFEPEHFSHLASYDKTKRRVEMHLRAERAMDVRVSELEMEISLKKGETIRTEICRKFTSEDIQATAASARLKVDRIIQDEDGWFSLALFAKADP